jgi:hypothetical protein
MRNLKLLGISITLLCVMSMTAFAGDTTSPPCAPGDTTSPPCASAQITADDSIAPGTVNLPPASDVEVSITEIAVDLLVDTLLIF